MRGQKTLRGLLDTAQEFNSEILKGQFYELNEVDPAIPGGIVQLTGRKYGNRSTHWSALEVRYPVDDRFRYRWIPVNRMTRCEAPKHWLNDPNPMTTERAYQIITENWDTPIAKQVLQEYQEDTSARDAMLMVIEGLERLATLPIRRQEQLNLFEQMIDALLDNKFIVTGIRMKQNTCSFTVDGRTIIHSQSHISGVSIRSLAQVPYTHDLFFANGEKVDDGDIYNIAGGSFITKPYED